MPTVTVQPEFRGIKPVKERVYFATAEELVEGQPLAWQETPANSTKGFPFDVEIPNTNNENFFAGVVHPDSIGVTGPDYIDIYVPLPGTLLKVLVSNAADLAVGDILKLNFDVPTAAGSELGAFDLALALATGTVSTSMAQDDIRALLVDAHKHRARLMESVGSSSVAARVLKWVQFI